MKHYNIAFFVPHIGCPHTCSFCNQNEISGESKDLIPNKEYMEEQCAIAAKSLGNNVQFAEIAFFGGSFTAIPKNQRLSLLKTAQELIKKYGFKGIRCSTRPDSIDEDILEEFIFYSGKSIELGCQSMNDNILSLNNRGHTVSDVEKASLLIKKFKLELGHQMMIGLYGSKEIDEYETAKKLISLKPDTIRIYPTVIIKGTELENLYTKGIYTPLSLEKAVDISSKILDKFNQAKVRVIRVGLHSELSFMKNMIGGPYHPAFRELCENKLFFEKILEKIKKQSLTGNILISCNPSDVSKVLGHKKINVKKFSHLGYNIRVQSNKDLEKGNIIFL